MNSEKTEVKKKEGRFVERRKPRTIYQKIGLPQGEVSLVLRNVQLSFGTFPYGHQRTEHRWSLKGKEAWVMSGLSQPSWNRNAGSMAVRLDFRCTSNKLGQRRITPTCNGENLRNRPRKGKMFLLIKWFYLRAHICDWYIFQRTSLAHDTHTHAYLSRELQGQFHFV